MLPKYPPKRVSTKRVSTKWIARRQEELLREQHPALKEAWDRYQLLLRLFRSGDKT